MDFHIDHNASMSGELWIDGGGAILLSSTTITSDKIFPSLSFSSGHLVTSRWGEKFTLLDDVRFSGLISVDLYIPSNVYVVGLSEVWRDLDTCSLVPSFTYIDSSHSVLQQRYYRSLCSLVGFSK